VERTLTKLQKALSIRVSLIILAGILVFAFSSAQAAPIGQRSVKLSNAEASRTNVTYELTLDRPTSGTLGSIRLQICTNNPFPGEPCTVPAGLDFVGSTVSFESGITGMSVSPLTTANELILTKTPSAEPNGLIVVRVSGVTNPSNNGTQFARIQTYPTDDATGPPEDEGGAAFVINRRFNVSTEVPPFLTLCVGKQLTGFSCSQSVETFLDLGEFSSNAHKSDTSQILLATNAQYGVNLFLTGSTLTSGSNVIPAMTTNASPQLNKSQFGINLRYNSSLSNGANPVGAGIVAPTANYNQPNSFRFVSGETIAQSSNSTDYSKLTVTYLVDINKDQKPGIYNSTIIYIATASF
jgi:hypothetical protein